MNTERWIRVIAGTLVLLSVAMSHPKCPLYVSENMLFLTTFVGFMLFQSGLTRFCPMEYILKALGVKPAAASGK